MVGTALAALFLLAVASAAQADRIRDSFGVGHDGQITGMGAKGLIMKIATGTTQEIPLGTIKDITADQFPALTKAEAAYAKGVAGDAAALADAEKLYAAMVSTGAPDWLRLLIQVRMYRVYLDSGRAVQALDAYVGMAQANPALVAGQALPGPAANSDTNKAMLKKVETALSAAAGKPYAADLKALQLKLLSLEGTAEQQLVAILPLLKDSDPRTRATAFVRKAELLVELKKPEAAAAVQEAAAAAGGEEYAPNVAYLRGRIYQDGGKNMEAAVEFMRVAILYAGRDKARTAESLYRAGQSLDAAKVSKAEVRAIFKEAAERYAGTPFGEKAKTELNRLGTS
jgi:hypothetical protein